MHSLFIDHIWGADLADMQSTSKFNKGFSVIIDIDNNKLESFL